MVRVSGVLSGDLAVAAPAPDGVRQGIIFFPHFQGMANHRNPNTPSSSDAPSDPDETETPPPPSSQGAPLSPGAGEMEITLDDYEERPLQRPRLPDHRRERPSMEIGGMPMREQPSAAPMGASDSFESNKAAQEHEWEPVTPDEIESYDPSGAGIPAGRVASATPVPPAAVESEPEPAIIGTTDALTDAPVEPETAPVLDDIEEFIAKTATEGPPAAAVKIRRPLSLAEKVSFGAGGAILLVLAVWLVRAVTSVAGEKEPRSDGWPDVPIKGALVTITEAASNWRKRADTDRVAQMEVILPSPGLQLPEIIPQVTFTIDPDASREGYLRFIFRDSEGKPRGDTRVVHVKGGKLSPSDMGEIIKGDNEGAVYGSNGLINIHAYNSYTGNNQPRWSVEVAESAAYDADDKDWKVLGAFEVRNYLED
jgi:hypothetical protein